MIRQAALVMGALLFALVLGFEFTAGNAQAASKIDCGKVMSELGSGKKPKDIATEMKISTSSIYRCKKRAAAAAKGATGAQGTPKASPSPAAAHM